MSYLKSESNWAAVSSHRLQFLNRVLCTGKPPIAFVDFDEVDALLYLHVYQLPCIIGFDSENAVKASQAQGIKLQNPELGTCYWTSGINYGLFHSDWTINRYASCEGPILLRKNFDL